MHSPGKSYVGVGSIASHNGSELFLCERHYQLVYRMKNARESACNICGVKHKHAKESARRFLYCLITLADSLTHQKHLSVREEIAHELFHVNMNT